VKRLFLKTTLFSLPVFGVLLALLGLVYHIGELTPPDEIIAQQAGDTPLLCGPGSGGDNFTYKLDSVETRRPDVIVIGSSRVMQFQSGILDKDPRFYRKAGPSTQPQNRDYWPGCKSVQRGQ
jgi:hypothetical protein